MKCRYCGKELPGEATCELNLISEDDTTWSQDAIIRHEFSCRKNPANSGLCVDCRNYRGCALSGYMRDYGIVDGADCFEKELQLQHILPATIA